jgi:trimeric autotransporter adhesin
MTRTTPSDRIRRGIRTSLVAVAWLILLSAGADAQSAGAPTPLEKIIGEDGSIIAPPGTVGTFDPTGWTMTTDASGAPRFVRKESSTLLADPRDVNWDDRFGPPGVGGQVNAVAASGDEIFVAGRFRVAGTTIANNVVAFNTTTRTWHVLGTSETNGVGGPVYALSIFNGSLYVGGTFESAGGVRASGIARWDISRRRWSSLGGGVANVENTAIYPGHVYAIAVDSQSVFVGGLFLMADADTVGNLARWDVASQSWSAACKSDVNRTNGIIHALELDGRSLYVGGEFTLVADIVASRIAKWDLANNTWSSLGAGVDGTVYAIEQHAGRIVVGGLFDSSGTTPARHIAQWDGSRWQPVGPGLDAAVRALHSDGGSLYVGGAFTSAASGSVALNGVARWSGEGFLPVGLGVGGDTTPVVRSLVTSNGSLYAAGTFSAAGIAAAYGIAQWDTVWSALGRPPALVRHGADEAVHAVAIDGDNVYVGGDFSVAGGVRANRVARWSRSSGQWFALGSGIDGAGALVRSLALGGNNDLYVGGIFNGAGGVRSPGIVRWDGTRWSSVGGGVSGVAPFVFVLHRSGTNLYVGGAFDSAGGIRSPRIATWSTTGASWSTAGGGITGDTSYTYVSAIAENRGLWVGGEFTWTGDTRVNRLAYLSGGQWQAVGSSGRYGVNAPVSAIASSGDTMIVGGAFTSAGGSPLRHLARVRIASDGSTEWLSDALFPDGPVRALSRVGREIVVAGEFTHVGSGAFNRIARLDLDTRTWRGYDAGINGSVFAVDAIDDEVYAGGSFSSAGGARTANVAQWKRNAWSSMGSDPSIGINDTVFALAVRGTDVFVGGRFRTAGGLRTNGIALWDGSRWMAVGGGVGGVEPTVRALAVAQNGDLYAGGSFSTAGGDTVNGVARWDGARWSALGTGVSGFGGNRALVNAVAIGDDAVYVGGRIGRAGGIPVRNVARWTPSSSSWSALGTGVDGGLGALVNALVVHNGLLVAAGRFDSAGALRSPGVAGWNGTEWQPMGSVKLEGRALASRGVDLILATGGIERVTIPPASSFLRSAHYLLRWNGADWTTLDSGGGVIYSLALDDFGSIYAGGWFSSIGMIAANGVAQWSGGWTAMGSGLVGVDHMGEFTIGTAFALATLGGSVYAGGNFIIAGQKPSYYFARWGAPVSSAPPVDDVVLARITGIDVHCSPNPVDRGATLRIDAAAPVAIVRLFDMLGQERLRLAPSAGERVVDMVIGRHLDAGAYLVRVETEEGVGTGRIVVR